MISIKFENANEVEQLLDKIVEKTQHREDLMHRIAGTMKSAVDQNFAAGGRPKWAGLRYRQGSPLIDSGELRNSIQAVSDNDSAVVGTNILYAPLHHFGGVIAPKNKPFLAFKINGEWVFTKKPVKIPARPFMVLTEEDKSDILNDVQRKFRDILNGVDS